MASSASLIAGVGNSGAMTSNRRYSLPDVINIAPGGFFQPTFSSPVPVIVDTQPFPFGGQAEMSSASGSRSRKFTTTGGNLALGDLISTSTVSIYASACPSAQLYFTDALSKCQKYSKTG